MLFWPIFLIVARDSCLEPILYLERYSAIEARSSSDAKNIPARLLSMTMNSGKTNW